jgi:hypothetical protein
MNHPKYYIKMLLMFVSAWLIFLSHLCERKIFFARALKYCKYSYSIFSIKLKACKKSGKAQPSLLTNFIINKIIFILRMVDIFFNIIRTLTVALGPSQSEHTFILLSPSYDILYCCSERLKSVRFCCEVKLKIQTNTNKLIVTLLCNELLKPSLWNSKIFLIKNLMPLPVANLLKVEVNCYFI